MAAQACPGRTGMQGVRGVQCHLHKMMMLVGLMPWL